MFPAALRCSASVLVASALAGGCSASSAAPAAPRSAATAAVPTPDRTPAAGAPVPSATSASPNRPARTPSATATDELPDGTTYGYLTEADPAGRTVTVDVVQWFTGAAAAAACKADGQPASETEICNDYYIRNTNTRLRTLPVAPDAPFTMATGGAAGTSPAAATFAQVAAALPVHQLYRFRLRTGTVTRVDEVYRP